MGVFCLKKSVSFALTRFDRLIKKWNLLVTVLLSLCFCSCITQQKMEYFQSETRAIQEFQEAKLEDYQIKPDDELYIQVTSLDDPSSSVFSTPGSRQLINLGTIQPYGASLSSYTVNTSGYILLPVVGLINVEGKSISRVSEIITESLKNVLNEPVVTVKLVNRFVSVLGEVRNPGHFVFAQEKLSIFGALGFAGDITDYGNRNNVIIARNKNGKNFRIPLDLTNSDILSSEYFYLKPGDIIYVKPLPEKFWELRHFPYDVILSAITATILFYSVVK